MTPHPEDAMTREQVLEKALRPFARIGLTRDDEPDSLDMISGPDLAITPKDVRKARRALASAQQEPAPAADAKEVADDIYAIAWDAYMDAIAATDHRPPSSSGLRAALTAALRRYAGDGGATEEQVEAGARVLAAQRGHKNLAEPIRCVGNTTRAVWQFYCDDARQILEAAARAKPSEKGHG